MYDATTPYRVHSRSDFIIALNGFIAEKKQFEDLMQRIDAFCINTILKVVELELVSKGFLVTTQTKSLKTEQERARSRASFDPKKNHDFLVCKKSDVNEKIGTLKARHTTGFEVLSIEDGLSEEEVKIHYKWKRHVSDKYLNEVTQVAARIPRKTKAPHSEYIDVILSNDGGQNYCLDFVEAVRHTVSYKHIGGIEATLSEIFDQMLVKSTESFSKAGALFEVHGNFTLVGCHPDEKRDILSANCLMYFGAKEIKNPQSLLFELYAYSIPLTTEMSYNATWEEGVDFRMVYSEEDKKFYKQYLREFDVENEALLREIGTIPRYNPQPYDDSEKPIRKFEGTLSQFNESIRQEIKQYRTEKHQQYEEFYKTISTSPPSSPKNSPRKRGRSVAFIKNAKLNSGLEPSNINFYKLFSTGLSEFFRSIIQVFG